MRLSRTTVLIGVLPALLAAPVHAQALEARMRSFLAAVGDESRIGEPPDAHLFAPFFPRAGEWTRMVTFHRFTGNDSVAIERYRTAELARLLEPGAPLCGMFDAGTGDVGPVIDEDGYGSLFEPGEWTRVRGNRFVAPGRPADSPVFVEWKMEDGRWVISSIGDYWEEGPPDGDRPPLQAIVRDSARTELRLPLGADTQYGPGRPWFDRYEPIEFDGMRYIKYGLPRRLSGGEVVRFGTTDGVPVAVEPGEGRIPSVVYVAVDSGGSFQPYQAGPVTPCWVPESERPR